MSRILVVILLAKIEEKKIPPLPAERINKLVL